MRKISSIIFLVAAIFVIAPSATTVSAQQPSAKERIEAAKAQQQAQMDSIKAVREAQQEVYNAQNTTYLGNTWVIVLCVIGACIGLYIRNKSQILSIIQTFTGDFRTKGDLTTLESKKILAGAIYASQQGAYLNTLKANIDDGRLHTILKDWWSIYGRDEATETLDYLRDKAYSYYFPTVWKAFQAGSDEERKSIITENMTSQEDAEKAYEQTHNLLESVDCLKKLNIIQHADDIEKYGVMGWDVGRLVFIARICFDAGYISEEEAWTYIDVAYAQAQRTFNSWEELSKSYQIGRFIWRGKDADDGMHNIANDLVNSPKSPWQQVEWR
jgi:hypothetical protein